VGCSSTSTPEASIHIHWLIILSVVPLTCVAMGSLGLVLGVRPDDVEALRRNGEPVRRIGHFGVAK
jgi:hypothetical protein